MICQPCRTERHDNCDNVGKDYPGCFCQHVIRDDKGVNVNEARD